MYTYQTTSYKKPYQTYFLISSSQILGRINLSEIRKQKKKHKKQDELRKVVCRPVRNLRGCIFALSSGGNVCVQSSRLLDEPAPGELVFRKRILCIHACSTPAKPGPARQDVKLRHLNNFI